MKKIGFIFGFGSLFLALSSLQFNIKDINSSNESEENKNEIAEEEITDQILLSFSDKYQNNSNLLTLNNGIIKDINNDSIIEGTFNGEFLIENKALNHYDLDFDYKNNDFESNLEISNGGNLYTSISYLNNHTVFNSNNELNGIFNYLPSLNSKLAKANFNNISFESIFSSILNIDEDYKIYNTSDGYLIKENNSSILINQNYELKRAKGIINDTLSYDFNFLNQELNKRSYLNEENTDLFSVLKDLLKEKRFDIDFEANVKNKTKDLKFNGNLKADYTNSFYEDEPRLNITLNHYTNKNLSNHIFAAYENDNIYFEFNEFLDGKIEKSTANELINIASSFMDDSFSNEVELPLISILNTQNFENILNKDFNSLPEIRNLEIKHNLISFDTTGETFDINDSYIKFEIGLQNLKLKTIKIIDLDTSLNESLDFKLRFNESNGVKDLKLDKYPSYDFIIPLYKNIMTILKTEKMGGNIGLTIDNTKLKSTFNLNSLYDLDYDEASDKNDPAYLNLALTNLNLNLLFNQNNNELINTLTMQNNLNKNEINLSLDKLVYQDETIYTKYKDYKFKLEMNSILDALSKINGLTSNQNNDYSFSLIEDELKELDFFLYFLTHNDQIDHDLNAIKNDLAFSTLDSFLEIKNNNNGTIELTLDMYHLLNNNALIINHYGIAPNVKITIDSFGTLLGININGLSYKNNHLSFHLGENYFHEDNFISSEEALTYFDLGQSLDFGLGFLNQIVNIKGVPQTSIINFDKFKYSYKDKNNKTNSLNISNDSKIKSNFLLKEDNSVDAYIEGSLNIDTSSLENEIQNTSLDFIYNTDNSSLNNRYSEINGLQAKLQFGYGENDFRNNSSMHFYSDNNTPFEMINYLSNIPESNLLYPLIKDIKLNLIQNTIEEILARLNGDFKIEDLLKLDLSFLSNFKIGYPNESSLKISFDVSDKIFNNGIETNKYHVNLLLGSIIEEEKTIYFVESLEVKDDSNLVDIKLSIDSTSALKDQSIFNEGEFQTKDEISYIEMSQIYNLLKLGIRTTENRYFRLSGDLNVSAKMIVSILLPIHVDVQINLATSSNNELSPEVLIQTSNVDSQNEIFEIFVDSNNLYFNSVNKDDLKQKVFKSIKYLNKLSEDELNELQNQYPSYNIKEENIGKSTIKSNYSKESDAKKDISKYAEEYNLSTDFFEVEKYTSFFITRYRIILKEHYEYSIIDPHESMTGEMNTYKVSLNEFSSSINYIDSDGNSYGEIPKAIIYVLDFIPLLSSSFGGMVLNGVFTQVAKQSTEVKIDYLNGYQIIDNSINENYKFALLIDLSKFLFVNSLDGSTSLDFTNDNNIHIEIDSPSSSNIINIDIYADEETLVKATMGSMSLDIKLEKSSFILELSTTYTNSFNRYYDFIYSFNNSDATKDLKDRVITSVYESGTGLLAKANIVYNDQFIQDDLSKYPNSKGFYSGL